MNSDRQEILDRLTELRLIDPHTHINPHAPASSTLADVLGYHYYTELAHSAGMPKELIEASDATPKQLVERLVRNLGPIENTAQYSWLIDICRTFFGFDSDRLDESNWEDLYDRSESIMAAADWPQSVLDQSNVQAVFLTNDFDDDLAGFDTETYIPCLRTDDLVFHLAKPEVRSRLEVCTGVSLDGSLSRLRESLHQRFEHFVGRGARACAISLPPTFEPTQVSDGRASTALDAILRGGIAAADSHKDALARRVFWTLAELCDEFGLPFDLMIGVNRGVYAKGVYQGQDLFDSRVSLIQYRELFNAFPNVKFPVSVLASVTNQELVSYSWIFPNVITNGHWWYSNTPSIIRHDAANRLEAVPQTKQIGYYSDAYKLEFVWPKFGMYRTVLSNILYTDFVEGRGWSVDRAVELGRRVLKDNVEDIFPAPKPFRDAEVDDNVATVVEEPAEGEDAPTSMSTVVPVAIAAGASALASSDPEETKPDGDLFETRMMEEPKGQVLTDGERVSNPGAALDGVSDEDDGLDSTVEVPKDLLKVTDSAATVVDEPDQVDSDAPTVMEFDPVPESSEIEALQLDDVTLVDAGPEDLADDAKPAAPDAAELEQLVDDEPLDVGDLTVTDETDPSTGALELELDFPEDDDEAPDFRVESDGGTQF
ncbi:MAG: glucuronate isomerase [Planctomycetota bacterium]